MFGWLFGRKTVPGRRGEPLPVSNDGPPDSSTLSGFCPRCEVQSSFQSAGSIPVTFDGGYLIEHTGGAQPTFTEQTTVLICRHCHQGVTATVDPLVKGYLKQQLAEYTNFVDPAKAQELQLSALTKNSRLLKPIAGATYSKLSAPATSQAVAAVEFMMKFLEGNDLIIWTNGLLDDLDWGEDGSRRFEAAMMELGQFLGFGSERPEEKIGRGPDNLWALGALSYLVIECKSGAVIAEKISKADTNQLNGSIVWFDGKYDKTCAVTPILVHPKTVFEHAASPHAGIRIVNGAGLTKLRNAIQAYSVSLATSGGIKDAKEVEKQLRHHKLAATEIVALCTVAQGAK